MARRWSCRNAVVAVFAIFILSTLYDILHQDSHISQLSQSAVGWYRPGTTLVHDAHRQYRTPNDFLGHFDAVIRLPPLKLADTKAGCTWSEIEQAEINFQFGGGQFGPPTTEWVLKDNETGIAEKRQKWQDYIKNDLIPWDPVKDRFQGRGIIVIAGNEESIPRLEVLLRSLKQRDCTLPVEIHYFGSELSDENRKHITSLYHTIFFNDLSDPHNLFESKYLQLANFQFKSAALFNSRFAEPLLLDSDNIPTIDPETLWESKTYKEYGSVFWPDIARTYPQNPIWAITNTPCRMDEYEQESGQVLVNKTQYFYHLQLAAWLNSADVSYRGILLGDKDIFRFAWHALKTPYGRPASWLTSVGIVQDDGMFCGHTFGQHHPDPGGPIAFAHGGLLKTIPPEGLRHWKETGGVFRHIKRSSKPEDLKAIVPVGIRFRNGENIPVLGGEAHWMCTDMFNVEPEPISAVLPEIEKTFTDIGGYWKMDGEQKDAKGHKPTM